MKSLRQLKGHKRMLAKFDELPTGRGRPAPGGWHVECTCGWYGGTIKGVRLARDLYRTHLERVAKEVLG